MRYEDYLEAHGYEDMSAYDPDMEVEDDDACYYAKACDVCGRKKCPDSETVLAIQEEDGDWYFICQNCLEKKLSAYDVLGKLQGGCHWEEMDYMDYMARAEGRW